MLLTGNERKDYLLIRSLKKRNEKLRKEIEVNERIIRDVKTGIRNLRKERERTEKKNVYNWKSYKGYWDSRYCRIEYEGIPNEAEIKEYIDEEWERWYNPYGDGRDCTGVWFTTSIHVFPLPKVNKTVVYHIQDCDV